MLILFEVGVVWYENAAAYLIFVQIRHTFLFIPNIKHCFFGHFLFVIDHFLLGFGSHIFIAGFFF